MYIYTHTQIHDSANVFPPTHFEQNSPHPPRSPFFSSQIFSHVFFGQDLARSNCRLVSIFFVPIVSPDYVRFRLARCVYLLRMLANVCHDTFN